MSNTPVPMSKETLLAILDDIRAHVEADDSFEGSLEYLMPYPQPCPTCEGTVGRSDCEFCSGKGEVEYPDGTEFVARAAYRIGNSQGQGGMRLIGDRS